MSFSKMHDACDYYHKNVYVIVLMFKLNFKIKIVIKIKSLYSNEVTQVSIR